MPRQGPGDNASTRKAFAILTDLPPNPSILDVGCGSGMQTLELAKLINGKIVALDIHQPYLDILTQNAKKLRLDAKITPVNQSMLSMNFDDEGFDVIWCEGAVFVYGMERALHDWKKFIKRGGYFVFSELCWLKGNIPHELADFFNQEYPAMTTLEENKKTIESQGYDLKAHFTIPEESWWSQYYSPLEPNLVQLKKKYHNDKEKIAQLDQVSLEISMYRKYPTYYGNVFFILKKK